VECWHLACDCEQSWPCVKAEQAPAEVGLESQADKVKNWCDKTTCEVVG
jgi:hypothetical protein